MASLSTCFTITAKPRPSSRLSLIVKQNSQFHSLRSQGSLAFQNHALSCEVVRRSRSVCGSGFVVKASFDAATAAIRPGRAVESDKLPADVRKRAMDAVEACGGRVTIGDVASKSGLKVNEAQKALQALAADTDGFLEVSDEGDVVYVFPKDYRSKLAAKSFKVKIEPLVEKAKSAAEYTVRVSFGTALIASIVIVYTAILALLSSRSEEDNRGRRGRSYDSGFSFYLRPSDFLWYWDPYYYKKPRKRAEGDGMNFIESVFSFVFGDGDPNQGIEEERWKLIGEYIAYHGGVVTADELAPYLDLEGSEEKGDDSYILPVLLRLDGEPEVDEGNIVYRFPSLQRTASAQRSGKKEYVGRKWADWVGGVDKFFKEKKWPFSKASASERAMVIGLGGLNLFGVIILGTMLKTTTVTPTGFLTLVADIFPALQIYAGSFFAIPLVRWFLVRKKNADIEKRNSARQRRALALERPDLALRLKLLSARDMAQKTFIGKDRIVYSTDKDMLEQDYEGQEWDRRFREVDKAD